MSENFDQDPSGADAAGHNPEHDFLVVGLGASAGGIGALKEFFTKVPADSRMAYVVILHLSPDHDSQLAEVLQSAARIPVTQVTDHVRIEPDRVYVIPPDRNLAIKDGHLDLSKMASTEVRRAPVDIFFRTLAESHRERAVAVVLSGTGANGSMGLKRVKERGGCCIVQDPREAEYADMPRNALATDMVDYVLPVAEMPAQIIAYRDALKQIRIPEVKTERPELTEADEAALRDILTQLRVRTGHDFSNYKRATVLRRIARRMGVHELSDLTAYSQLMHEHPQEAQALLKDLLISVTNFYRDTEAFEALEREVIPRLFEGKSLDDQVRAWVAGCATGEEAYTLAMMLADYSLNLPTPPQIQVFATDIDESAIATARDGTYTLNDAADIPPERLARYFVKEADGEFRVRREIRERVLFAVHNVIKDPPFSHLDLVTCRNLLIYLNPTAQRRVMDVLHFALNPGGYLMLGASESVDGANDLYVPVDKEHRIYQGRAVETRLIFPVPDGSLALRLGKLPELRRTREARPATFSSYSELHQRLLERYAPPSVVVNEDYDIMHMSETAGRYMEVRGGEPSTNLLALIRPELRLELRAALYQATQKRTDVESRGVTLTVGDETKTVDLIVRPALSQEDKARGFILVLFEERRDAERADEPRPLRAAPEDDPVARQLEEELLEVRQQLSATIEQHELQREELKASNEELQAMNEEMRSAAEELETSKEELQSINEELTTVNQELKIKIEELGHSNDDLKNLMNSTQIGTIFLDRSLCVKLFTPRARDLFNLIPADVGRPLTDITSKLDIGRLIADARTVLETLRPVERVSRSTEGRVYLLQIAPYRTTEDRINGVVISFFDITERHRAEEALRVNEERMRGQKEAFQAVVNGAPLAESLNILARMVNRETAGQARTAFYMADPDGISLHTIRGAGNMPDSYADQIDGFLIGTDSLACGLAVPTGEPVVTPGVVEEPRWKPWLHVAEQFEYRGCWFFPIKTKENKAVGTFAMYFREPREATPQDLALAEIVTQSAAVIIGSHIEQQERARAEEALRESEEKYRTLFDSIDEGYLICEVIFDEDDKPVDILYLDANPAAIRLAGRDFTGRRMREIDPDYEDYWYEMLGRVALTGEAVRAEHYAAPHGRWFDFYVFKIGGRESRRVASVFQDTTERRKAVELLRESESRLTAAFESVPASIAVIDLAGKVIIANAEFRRFIPTGVIPSRDPERVSRWKAWDKQGRLIAPQNWPSARALRGESVIPGQEMLFTDDDGREIWTNVSTAPTYDHAGRVTGCVSVISDITERRRVEEALRMSGERLRLLVESATDYAIFTMTLDNRIDSWNAGAEKLFGWTETEAVGQSGEIIFTPEDREKGELERELETTLREGSAPDERWHVRKDGSRFYVSGVMHLLSDAEGRAQGFAKIARDISAQRRAEEELRRAHSMMEEQVRERTLELAQANESLRDEISQRIRVERARVRLLRQLVRAQEDERRRIARDIHDHLGQQTTALRLNLDTLNEGRGEDEELRRKLEQAKAIAERLDADVDFLAWELRPAALDDIGLAEALATYVRDWSKYAGVEAAFHTTGMDKGRLAPETETNLYRIAQEALNNAMKYARARRVDVLLERRDEQVVLIVEDDGVGFNLKKVEAGDGEGGMGLIGMRERAALVGGSLEIESRPKEGTTVFARVPVRFLEEEAEGAK